MNREFKLNDMPEEPYDGDASPLDSELMRLQDRPEPRTRIDLGRISVDQPAKPESNRDNPDMVAYFQNTADVLGIFWEYHKAGLEAGNLHFASMLGPGKLVAFDPMDKINRWRDHKNPHTHKILQDFSEAVHTTLEFSWAQFLQELELIPDESEWNDVLPTHETQRRFITPYTKQLARETDLQARQFARASIRDGADLPSIGKVGMDTGATATTQLAAIFGETFSPRSVLMLAKVRQKDVGHALKEIGLPEPHEQHAFKAPPGDYSLLEDSPTGLNRGRLRELGLGDTLGCPAAMRMSETAETFLRGTDASPKKRTMLEDFADMLPQEFERYVTHWYAALTPEQRQEFIDPEQERILSGEIRRALPPSS